MKDDSGLRQLESDEVEPPADISAIWRDLDFFLPSHLTEDDAKKELHLRVVAVADEAGEFVHRIRISGRERHSDNWVRWRTSYLFGPPVVRGRESFGEWFH